MNMYKVDLNSDLGESFGRYTLGMDEKIIPLISSANIACGFHASDPVVMMESVTRTKEAGIRIGAHPGFPDLMGFGRRNMAVSPAEAKAYTLYQISALSGMCQAQGMKLQHVKPHGALYNMAAKDYELSLAICEAIKEYDPELIVMGLSGSETIRAAKDCGLKAASEVFADRGDPHGERRKSDSCYGKRHRYPGGFGVRARRRRESTPVCGEDPHCPESRRNRDRASERNLPVNFTGS